VALKDLRGMLEGKIDIEDALKVLGEWRGGNGCLRRYVLDTAALISYFADSLLSRRMVFSEWLRREPLIQ